MHATTTYHDPLRQRMAGPAPVRRRALVEPAGARLRSDRTIRVADLGGERHSGAKDEFQPGVFVAAVTFAGIAGAILALLV